MKVIEGVIDSIRKEQVFLKRANKPLELVMNGVEVALVFFITLLFICLLDIWFSSTIKEKYGLIEANKSVFHFFFKLLLGLVHVSILISEKLVIHDYSMALLIVSVLVSPPPLLPLKDATVEVLVVLGEDHQAPGPVRLLYPADQEEVQVSGSQAPRPHLRKQLRPQNKHIQHWRQRAKLCPQYDFVEFVDWARPFRDRELRLQQRLRG
eukprot:CAMPEP_0170552584 /NCGR_PEP_ID=MMETSP0211-20121228/10455_1 /TAXON_ID=311385 /ORGANISM="Pseudokeronopsis sp., Strain OXSARD2" /LENGTH=208 /DNA_ID=CAMNT_0010860377 /DNA_START=400 /DNA_END=1025 /DNA_ORIENTATION=-